MSTGRAAFLICDRCGLEFGRDLGEPLVGPVRQAALAIGWVWLGGSRNPKVDRRRDRDYCRCWPLVESQLARATDSYLDRVARAFLKTQESHN